jgi:tetratricopeptide (TPR) repeat protein
MNRDSKDGSSGSKAPGIEGRGARRRGPPRGRARHGGEPPPSRRAGAEAAILGALKEAERPLTTGDFKAQKVPFAKVLELLRSLRLGSIDELEFDARTRLFTALLRAGRQPPQEDAEKEARRRDILFTLGEIWRAVNDERRAALLFAASGRTAPAMKMLQEAGEWQEAASLAAREGRHAEAARILEQHKDYASALGEWRAAGEQRAALRVALLAGDVEAAREIAVALGPKVSRELLFRHNQADLYLDLLAGRGDWVEIGRLYERAEQWLDAAQAYERAGRTLKAAECLRKAGDLAGMERLVAAEAELRLARGDIPAAGDVLRWFGRHARAVEIARETRPDLAFQWLQQAGLDQQALGFALASARRARESGDLSEAARWLERAGDLPAAAQSWMEAGRPEDALRLYEQMGSWELAGEAALAAGQRDRAIELFRRAGVPEPDARAAQRT